VGVSRVIPRHVEYRFFLFKPLPTETKDAMACSVTFGRRRIDIMKQYDGRWPIKSATGEGHRIMQKYR
jgi:hypothetical protein